MSVNSGSDSAIRVLVVDDSAFMRTALARMISCEPDMEVAATACCGSSAFEKIVSLNPDVVTLDVEMPGLDGLSTLKCIMAQFPRPVIMVSAATEKDAETTFAALSAGAFDYVPKQLSPASLEIAHIHHLLVSKIRAAAKSIRSRNTLPNSRKPPTPAAPANRHSDFITPAVVAIGISTGGPKALEQILPSFPADFPIPMLIVQHMPLGFTAPFARRLDSLCRIHVREAVQNEIVRPGVAYLAPAGLHMRVVHRLCDSTPTISIDRHPDDAVHIPSVDVLMNSVAQVFSNRSIGVIMTGMGSDGAAGMSAIFHHGGITIGQDEASCTVYGMPRACAQLGILTHVLPLTDIVAEIVYVTGRRRPAV
jgi:two-component system chemotaxis response regulator CheB